MSTYQMLRRTRRKAVTLGRVASARMASACSTVRDAVTAISGTRGTIAMLRGSPGGSTSRSLPMPCERGAATVVLV